MDNSEFDIQTFDESWQKILGFTPLAKWTDTVSTIFTLAFWTNCSQNMVHIHPPYHHCQNAQTHRITMIGANKHLLKWARLKTAPLSKWKFQKGSFQSRREREGDVQTVCQGLWIRCWISSLSSSSDSDSERQLYICNTAVDGCSDNRILWHFEGNKLNKCC